MVRTVVAAALMVATIAGCGRLSDTRLNPFALFDRARPAPVTLREAAAADPRPLIDRIDSLAVTQTPGGAILRATGLGSVQGNYAGALIPVPAAPGTLAFEFRAIPPEGPAAVSTPRSREITVARLLDARELAGIVEIRVSGAQGARAVRR